MQGKQRIILQWESGGYRSFVSKNKRSFGSRLWGLGGGFLFEMWGMACTFYIFAWVSSWVWKKSTGNNLLPVDF